MFCSILNKSAKFWKFFEILTKLARSIHVNVFFTTGIQILRHVMIFRTSIGLSFGTSNPDTWRLKLSIRCQLLVDHSELCTNVIFNFSQLILEAKKKEKKSSFSQISLRVDGIQSCTVFRTGVKAHTLSTGWRAMLAAA